MGVRSFNFQLSFILWPGMALDAANCIRKSDYNQMLSRLAYSGKPMNFHVTLECESAYEFQSRNICVSCDHSSMEKGREPRRAGPGHGILSIKMGEITKLRQSKLENQTQCSLHLDANTKAVVSTRRLARS